MQPGPSFLKKLEAAPFPARAKRPIGVLVVLIQDFSRCDLLKQASAMAYVSLLSLVPSLVAIFCVLSLFSPMFGRGTNLVDQMREFILSNLAAGSGEQVARYLDTTIANLDLKKIGISSFASVLVTLILLLRQIEEALNRIWLVRKGRNIFTRFMYFWTALTLGTTVLAIIVGVSSGFNLRHLTTLQREVAANGSIAGPISSWLGGFAFFFFLYKFVPNCTVKARPASTGATVSATILICAGYFFTMFVRDAETYKTLYGAIAMLPVFLTLLYVCWVIILLGALIAWRLQEGFPEVKEEDTLDSAKSPVEILRNVQVKEKLPLIVLLAIYRQFQDGTGHGLDAQVLAHALKLPLGWVVDALDALEEMGYIIASKTTTAVEGDEATVHDPYYPAFPATSVPLSRLHADLGRPAQDWMVHWVHDLPLDLPQALKILATLPKLDGHDMTLHEALAVLPLQQWAREALQA